MLRRRVHCRRAAGVLSVGAPGTALLASTRFGFFDGLQDMMKKNAPSAGNSSASTDKPFSGKASSPFPAGLDMQKLKTMQDMFNSQPPEKQEQLMKQALEMQKMMSKMPGFKKISQMNTQVLEELMKQKHQQPAATAPASVGSQTGGGSTSSSGSSGASAFTPTPTQAPRASSGASGAPTLDDLKKVNLGPEIEALFEELRSIRKKKNEYRDLYNAEKAKADTSEKSRLAIEASEKSLRAKLKKAEQEVMLLTSENMEVRESAKNVKQLAAENAKLKAERRALQEKMQSSTSAGSPQYQELQAALQSKEEALRSLGRKVERMRRRDPLLHFSLCCNDIARLCELKASVATLESEGGATTATSSLTAAMKEVAYQMNHSGEYLSDDVAKDVAEERFADLQSAYVGVQQQAWLLAATGGTVGEEGNTSLTLSTSFVKPHAAAVAYTAFLRRLFLAKVPFSNYDAIVTVKTHAAAGGGAAAGHAALQQLFACVAPGMGYVVERFSEGSSAGGSNGEERFLIRAAFTATTRDMLRTPGPFAYAFALRAVTSLLHAAGPTPASQRVRELLEARDEPLAKTLAVLSVTHAQPFVSQALMKNSNRVAVAFEAARSSGPGGQAANVAETQIMAKLFIDQHSCASARDGAEGSGSVTVNGTTLRIVSADGSSGSSGSGENSGSGRLAEGRVSSLERGLSPAAGTGAAERGRAFAFAAESQDSRSALQNKTNATEKLLTTELKRYNDGPLRTPFGRCDDVEQVLTRSWRAEAGEVKLEDGIVCWCLEAAASVHGDRGNGMGGVGVPQLDAVLVLAFKRLVEEMRRS